MSESPNKTLFSIYIIEHEDGTISIMSECVGRGANAREIGHEIMANLTDASMSFPEAMRVSPITCSERRH